MTKSIAGTFLALVLSFSVSAQETFTYRFDWHGFSNLFRASFVVTEQDLATHFTSQLFHGSISVTNPLDQVFNSDLVSSADGSYSIGWSLGVELDDFQRGTQVFLIGGASQTIPYYTAGAIRETPLSTGPSWFEEGHWLLTQQIPEPSVESLAIIGVVALFVSGRKYR